jgi:hypothetical protein
VPFFQVWIDYDGVIEADNEEAAQQEALKRVSKHVHSCEVADELDDLEYRNPEHRCAEFEAYLDNHAE